LGYCVSPVSKNPHLDAGTIYFVLLLYNSMANRSSNDKVLYASDFPYVSLEESTKSIGEFFDRFEFSHGERSAILSENAYALLDRLNR
jgi:predicted TIM-barrel fold metal-dependent hydrolase